jgi:predicted MFS family arabinose efflux permease
MRRPGIADNEPLRDPDVRRLWIGETVAMVGAQISFLALPLAAILTLRATPVEVGILRAAGYIPFVLVILPAGAWLDRVRRRPVMLAANLGRSVSLAAVPAAFLLGVLSLPLLMVIAGLVGILTVLFEVAYLAYLPSLVGPERLSGANARFTASQSASQIGGPGLGGLLVGLIGAPLAIAFDAASLALSALAISRIGRPEPAPVVPEQRPPMVRFVADGVRFVVGDPILRALAAEAGMYNALWAGAFVAFLLYATNDLGLDPTLLGLALAVGGAGSLLGSLAIERAERRFGFGRVLSVIMLLGTVPNVGLALVARGPFALPAVMAILGITGFGVGGVIVLVVTLRQTATPAALLARSAATYRLVTYGVVPFGAVAGGLLVDALGARAALLALTIGVAASPLWIFASPLPRMRHLADVVLTGPPASTEPLDAMTGGGAGDARAASVPPR